MLAATYSRLDRLRLSAFSWFRTPRRHEKASLYLHGLFTVHVLVFALVVWGTAVTTPYLDMLTWQHDALEALKANEATVWFGHLLHPHNEHRLAFVRVLTLLDLTFGGGRETIFIMTTLLAVIVIAGLLWRVMTEHARAKDRLLALVIPMLILSSTAALDIGLPINCVYPLSLVFSVAAIVIFARAATAPRNNSRLLMGAMLCALLSPFGNMTGLVIWPVLTWLCWRSQAGWRISLITLFLGTSESCLYLWHDLPVHASGGIQLGLGAVMRLGVYAGVFLGLPFSRLATFTIPAIGLGWGLALVASAILVADCLNKKPATRATLVSTGLILIGLGVAAMASLGRVDESADLVAPARYSIYVVLFHTGLVMRVLLWFRTRPDRARPLGLKTGMGFATLLLLFQVVSGLAGLKAANDLRDVVMSWQPGLHGAHYTKLVFPDLSYAEAVRRDVDAYLLAR
ncbi:hypothetical protein [Asaia sp. HN010]|uniref:hypothetical protein n=1 Tax=Asaia sp. HN010 TaxID=3081233 RepID=UPI003019CDDE